VIARVFEAKGWTVGQYDDLMKHLVDELQLDPGRPAPGVVVHWAAPTADGVLAVDVYESREAADRLVSDSIGPIAARLDLPLPEITEYEVHNLLR